ncbi:MAG: hypothetical protein WAL78_05920 [Candidatus Acidiferrales bacterium]
MSEAARKVTMNCERCRTAMMDAATEGLAAARRAEFEAHVHVCAACREELQRVRMLLGAIDRGVAAEVAAEPPADLIRRVRQRIAEEGAAKDASPLRWVPVAACAAMVILAVAWMVRSRTGTPQNVAGTTQAAAKNPPPSSSTSLVVRGSDVAVKQGDADRKPLVVEVHRVAERRTLRVEREPEVLVPPGQMEEIMKLAAMLNSSQEAKTASVVAGLKQMGTDEPLEIKPLVIVPLEAAKEDGTAGGGGPDGTNPKFVGSEELQ